MHDEKDIRSIFSEIKSHGFSRRKFIHWMLTASAAAALPGLEALAADVKPKDDLPVVVIGAGLGGLISAALLAKSGFPVTLLESHDRPGGYATSFKRGDFDFEVSLHATVAANAMPQRILTEIGIWDKLNLVYTPELCRLVWPDLDLTLPQRDPETYARLLIRQFPDQAEGIRGVFNDFMAVHKDVRSGYAGPDSTLARLEKLTLTQWLDQHVKNERLQKILGCFWGYYGRPPSELNALYYAVATGEYIIDGGQYYKERSQDLSNLLMETIEAHGGRVLLKTGASGIDLKAGQVNAVTDSRGRRHSAKAIVANAAAPVVFGRLLPQVSIPADYLQKLNQKKPSLSSFIVWLGLDEELRGNIPGYEIFLRGQKPEEDLEARWAGDMENVGLAVTLYDNLYPGYSQPGKSTMSIFCLCGYQAWQKYEADYLAGRKTEYRREKKRVADLMIGRVEKTLIPGLNAMIETREAATPLTNLRFTANPGGAIYGYDLSHPRLDVRTPIEGLYLAGAWAMGGGYTPAMMSGRKAAAALMKDWRKLI